MTQRCVMIMAGGTGGHVFPALALAAVLRSKACDLVWLGTKRGIEARLVPEASIVVEWIDIGGLRGKGLIALVVAPWYLLRAVLQSIVAIRRHDPAVVVGLGGYVSGPGGIAAWLTRRPLVIHEQNAVVGFTNRVLALLATRVLEAFKGSFVSAHNAQAIGNPVRSEFFALATPADRFSARTGPLRILIVGGSQGAAKLNMLVPEALSFLAKETQLSIRHQSGVRGLELTREVYARYSLKAEVSDFIEDIAAAYAWADIVICRAGALTVSELAAVGVAAVLVPFPAAVDDHQTRNAEFLVARGAAVLMPESALTPVSLAAQLTQMCKDRAALLAMGERARSLTRPNAAEDLAAVCLSAGGLK